MCQEMSLNFGDSKQR